MEEIPIKTTGTHPYLTQSGWRKVAELTVGKEIAVPSLLVPDAVTWGDASNDSAHPRSRARPRPQWLTPLLRRTSQPSFPMGQSATMMPMRKKTTVTAVNSVFNHTEAIFPNTPPNTPATRNAWNSVNEVLESASNRFVVQKHRPPLHKYGVSSMACQVARTRRAPPRKSGHELGHEFREFRGHNTY